MKRKSHSLIAILVPVAFVLFSTGFLLGQQSAPTDYKLVREDVLAAIDLAKEIDGVQGRELRLSRAEIAPGGHIGLHSHRGDPTIVYVLSGVLTNHHDDGTTEDFHPGQVFPEFGPHSHRVENKGAVPVQFIAANIHHE
jgi:quercetin dioxygenase-like cupin family protein